MDIMFELFLFVKILYRQFCFSWVVLILKNLFAECTLIITMCFDVFCFWQQNIVPGIVTVRWWLWEQVIRCGGYEHCSLLHHSQPQTFNDSEWLSISISVVVIRLWIIHEIHLIFKFNKWNFVVLTNEKFWGKWKCVSCFTARSTQNMKRSQTRNIMKFPRIKFNWGSLIQNHI